MIILQYKYLKKLRENYNHLLFFDFTFLDLNYILIGIVNMPFSNDNNPAIYNNINARYMM